MGKPAKHSKTGNTKIVDGETVYEWSNGDWRFSNGRIYKSPNTKSITTSEQAAEMANLRHERRQEAIAKGAKKVIGGEYNPAHVKAEIAEVVGELAMTMAHDLENPRAALEHIKFVMAGIGDPVDMRASRNTMNIGKIEINIRPEVEDGLPNVIDALDAMYREVDDDVPF